MIFDLDGTLVQTERLRALSYARAAVELCQDEIRASDVVEAFKDDVENSKPDPEIYLLVAKELDVYPSECLVVEDSPVGVLAAQNAGMSVVAVSTPFTRNRLHESALLPESHIVDNPDKLPGVIAHVIEHINGGD
jgi:beta-phosphoglucomutase-like phosphatase (HAD superfamily)